MITTFADDLRLAWRGLRAQPTFLATAVLTLALGIGALAAIFTVYDAVLLKPLPFAQGDRLVSVTREQPPYRGSDSPVPQFDEWRERSTAAFDAFGAYAPETMNLAGDGEALRLASYKVTPGFWDVFARPLALGRAWDDDEERHNVRVVVLGDALWRTRFGAAADIVGRDVVLNGDAYRVVGVAQAAFRFPADAQAWMPTYAPGHAQSRRDMSFLRVIARLRDGVTVAQAGDVLRGVTDWQAATFPDTDAGLSAAVEPLQDAIGAKLRTPLQMLLAASALVLLIACANLANLMLARAQDRHAELALRRALGAGQRRLARQLVAEALVVTALGVFAGLALAWPATAALAQLDPGLLPGYTAPSLDLRVVAVTGLVAGATMLAFALVPAWRAAAADPALALRGLSRGQAGTRGAARARRVLVAAELALALTLLAGAGLLVDSLRRLGGVDTGVDARQVLTAQFSIPTRVLQPGEDLNAWAGQAMAALGPRLTAIEERLRAIGGVDAVSLSFGLPASGIASWSSAFEVVGDPAGRQPAVQYRFVSTDYFRTFGIPVEAGRAFDALDGTRDLLPTELLVNRAFATRFLGGGDAIGREIRTFGDAPIPVVGVVGDVRQAGLERDAQPELYFPLAKAIKGEIAIALKVRGDALAFAGPLREAMREVAPDAPVYAVRTLDTVIGSTLALRRFNASLMAVFAGVALTLAAVGLYGVVAYTVGRRRREIGLRQALGADTRAIHRLVLRSGLAMLLPGIAFGVVGALVVGRLVASQLYGVGSADPRVLAGVVAVLAVVALAACLVPTWRAARVAPLEALRDE